MHSAHLKVVDDVSEAEVVYTDVVHVWDVYTDLGVYLFHGKVETLKYHNLVF
jgi:hypothetical protein